MAEHADVTDNIFKAASSVKLVDILCDPAYRPYIKSLTVRCLPSCNSSTYVLTIKQISDQPREAPTVPLPLENRERHLILSLRLPPASKAAVTIPLVKAMFTLVDSLDKIVLLPGTRATLKKTRVEFNERMKKDLEHDKKEEVSYIALNSMSSG